MTNRIRYSATFSDGETIERHSSREYQAAWCASIAEREPARGCTERMSWTVYGFAKTIGHARRAAAIETRFYRETCDTATEVVPVEIVDGAI